MEEILKQIEAIIAMNLDTRTECFMQLEQVKKLKSLLQSELKCCIKKEPLREAGANTFPSFDEWIEKYFKTPKIKMMYERKDGGGEYDKAELIRKYNKAFGK